MGDIKAFLVLRMPGLASQTLAVRLPYRVCSSPGPWVAGSVDIPVSSIMAGTQKLRALPS